MVHLRLGLMFLFLFSTTMVWVTPGQSMDLTGTWESNYQVGPINEAMTAVINQVGSDILGSFSIKSSLGDEYSGIIFGTVEGDNVKANYLSAKNGNGDPHLIITHIDSKVTDPNTIRGTYYVQDSDMNSENGPFEAVRK